MLNYHYQIDAGEGNDFVYNENDSATVLSGADSIANPGRMVTIQSGSGNDSIKNEGSGVTISSGAGNDSIRNYPNCTNVTINAGIGNDTIVIDNGAKNFVHKSFNETSTLKIVNDTVTYSTTASGSNDVIG